MPEARKGLPAAPPAFRPTLRTLLDNQIDMLMNLAQAVDALPPTAFGENCPLTLEAAALAHQLRNTNAQAAQFLRQINMQASQPSQTGTEH